MPVEKQAELTDKLGRFLDLLLDGLQKGGDFVAEQTPLVIQELVAWKRAEHTLLAAFFLLLAIWLLWMRKRWAATLAKAVEGAYDEGAGKFFGWFGYGLLLTGFAAGFLIQTHYALQAWIAPRVYLIEYIHGMVKGR